MRVYVLPTVRTPWGNVHKKRRRKTKEKKSQDTLVNIFERKGYFSHNPTQHHSPLGIIDIDNDINVDIDNENLWLLFALEDADRHL